MVATVERKANERTEVGSAEEWSLPNVRAALGVLEGFDEADGDPEDWPRVLSEFPMERRLAILASIEKIACGVEEVEITAAEATMILRTTAPELSFRPLGSEVLAGGPPIPMSGLIDAMRAALEDDSPTFSGFAWWLALAAADAAAQGLTERKFRGHLVHCLGEAGLRAIGFRELREALRESRMWPKGWRR